MAAARETEETRGSSRLSDKKKDPEKKEIRAEDEVAYTITLWLCRVMLWTSLIWFPISFFKWYDILDSDETYRVCGSFGFAFFWIIVTLTVEVWFRGDEKKDGEPKADAVGFHTENDGDNSGSPV